MKFISLIIASLLLSGIQGYTGRSASTISSSDSEITTRRMFKNNMRQPMSKELNDHREMETDRMARLAKADLAQRLAIDISRIALMEVRRITWPDTSLGCPEAEIEYEKKPQKGGLIRLRAGKHFYFYHWSGTDAPFLCENSPLAQTQPPDDTGEWVPPPGLDGR